MKAYIYQATLLCEPCAHATRQELGDGSAPHHEDPEHYPQGPYPDGGGEADSPQHCDGCSTFLENPLTSDGYRETAQMIKADFCKARFDSVAITVWAEFYDLDTLTRLIDALKVN